MRKSIAMNYFVLNPKPTLGEFIDGSDLLTKEIGEHIEKYIPHRIISKGWKLVYGRNKDGSSFDRYFCFIQNA